MIYRNLRGKPGRWFSIDIDEKWPWLKKFWCVRADRARALALYADNNTTWLLNSEFYSSAGKALAVGLKIFSSVGCIDMDLTYWDGCMVVVCGCS